MKTAPLLVLALILMALSATGCSKRMAYEGARLAHRHGCDSLPQDDYRDCMERISPDYDTYVRDREAILGFDNAEIENP